jgi:hypothetical protein
MNEKGSGSVYDKKKQKQKQKQKQKKPKTYSCRSLHFLCYYLFDKAFCNDHDSSLAKLEDALESIVESGVKNHQTNNETIHTQKT